MLCIKLIERNRRRIQTLAYIFRGDPQIHTGFLARPKRFLGIEAEKLCRVVVERLPFPSSASIINFQQPTQVRRPDSDFFALSRAHSRNSTIRSLRTHAHEFSVVMGRFLQPLHNRPLTSRAAERRLRGIFQLRKDYSCHTACVLRRRRGFFGLRRTGIHPSALRNVRRSRLDCSRLSWPHNWLLRAPFRNCIDCIRFT